MPHRLAPDAAVDQAIKTAIAQINPRLKVLDAYRDRLDAPMRQAIDYLHAQMQRLPPSVNVTVAAWAETPLLRAFFACAQDISRTLGASGALRHLFAKTPELEAAYFALGVSYQERSAEGMSPCSMDVRSDLARQIVCFASPWIMACGPSEREVRQQLHDEWLDYLVAQSMVGIGEQRQMRQALEEEGALLRVHLKRLPVEATSAAEILRQLKENEGKLAHMGDAQTQLQAELVCLCDALTSAQSYLRFARKQLRLSHLNEVLDEDSLTVGQEVAFTQINFDGVPSASRAFFIGRVKRSEMPAAKINFAGAERLL